MEEKKFKLKYIDDNFRIEEFDLSPGGSSPFSVDLSLRQKENLNMLSSTHVNAFNSLFSQGLMQLMVDDIGVRERNGIKVWLEGLKIRRPRTTDGRKLTPQIARTLFVDYCGTMSVNVWYSVNGGSPSCVKKKIGPFPIMVGSSMCNTPESETEPFDVNGYFIVNGAEKLLRLTMVQRRNIAFPVRRNAFKTKAPNFTDMGLSIRCTRPDQTSKTITLHYLNTKEIVLRVSHNRAELLVPVMLVLRSLTETTDYEIYNSLRTDYNEEHIECLLRSHQRTGLFTQKDCRRYLGSKFMKTFNLDEESSCTQFLSKFIFVHLQTEAEKFRFMLLCIHDLIKFVCGKSRETSTDTVSSLEVLCGPHVMLEILKAKLISYLDTVSNTCVSYVTSDKRPKKVANTSSLSSTLVSSAIDSVKTNIGAELTYFISTGNVRPNIDQMQTVGYSIVLERLNFLRTVSHVCSIHRGTFFTEMRNTSARKLLPEAWGYLCPIHTPDGDPCGLLNHLAVGCVVSNTYHSTLYDELVEYGIVPYIRGRRISCCGESNSNSQEKKESNEDGTVLVICDGNLMGTCARAVEKRLRAHKVKNGLDWEIILLEDRMLIQTTPNRFTRTVFNKQLCSQEKIGALEQIYLDVSMPNEDSDSYSYREIDPQRILSLAAAMTTYSDHNQSPRSVYQCQMAKQTLGTPFYAYGSRFDNKAYRLVNPQRTVVRPRIYDDYSLDTFPMGTNAVVAVLSYTAYDMEDAMVLNRSAIERGMFRGILYRTRVVELEGTANVLAKIGSWVEKNDVIAEGRTARIVHDGEGAYVDAVCIEDNVLRIRLRVPRNPVIGDKFSSRHGQKGVCSRLWRAEDMPFTEDGVIPDLLINPHAFPSRMTIGMLLDSLAGKIACMKGRLVDATPFVHTEKKTVLEELRCAAKNLTFDPLGCEPMYSGVYGNELYSDVFIGVVYYQRLRHMVLDKYQVRTTGPVNALTQQPVKGRKKHGGIRFGEMERDALLAHGCSYIIKDRLLDCSDKSTMKVCTSCRRIAYGRCCGVTRIIEVPYVFKYLAAELAVLNIKLLYDVERC